MSDTPLTVLITMVRSRAQKAKEMGLKMPVGGPVNSETQDQYRERIEQWLRCVSTTQQPDTYI